MWPLYSGNGWFKTSIVCGTRVASTLERIEFRCRTWGQDVSQPTDPLSQVIVLFFPIFLVLSVCLSLSCDYYFFLNEPLVFQRHPTNSALSAVVLFYGIFLSYLRARQCFSQHLLLGRRQRRWGQCTSSHSDFLQYTHNLNSSDLVLSL
jgi:hypothetical protein